MSARLRRRYVRRARARAYPPYPDAWGHNPRMVVRRREKARKAALRAARQYRALGMSATQAAEGLRQWRMDYVREITDEAARRDFNIFGNLVS